MTTLPAGVDERALLEALLDTGTAGLGLLDAQGRLLCSNACMQRMLGYTADQLHGRPFVELTHAGDAATTLALFEELVAGERRDYQMHKRYLHKEGRVVWARETVVRHGSVAPLYVLTVDDVSAARATEERLRALVHALNERLKELTALHQAARTLWQTKLTRPQQLQTVVELLPPAMQYPELTTARICYGDEIYEAGAHHPTDWMLAEHFLTADGRAGSIEVAYTESLARSVESTFMPEERALLVALAEMIRASIDRQHMERALQEANERMSLAFEAVGAGVWEWDVARGTVHWSPQLSRMLGISMVSGKFATHRELVHPDDRDRLFERLQRASDGLDDLNDLDLRMRRADGKYLCLRATARVLREPPARATRVIAVLVDMTEQRELQAALQRR